MCHSSWCCIPGDSTPPPLLLLLDPVLSLLHPAADYSLHADAAAAAAQSALLQAQLQLP
jgi:hypothetical protein